MRLVITALVCLLSLSSPAATLYVTLAGNDGNAGTQASPWRTIQKSANTAVAGDTVNISSGDYDEYVQTANSGSSGSPITFQANPTNSAGGLITREFRIKNRFITLSGFTFTKMNDINNAAIRIDGPGAVNNGSDYVITNCTIKDMCFLLSRTADFGSNYVHIRDAYEGLNFNNAGFKTGMNVFWGADSLKFFTNHGTGQTILSNSADGLTMYVQGTISADAGTNYWIAVAAGSDNSTYKGILAPLASSVGASNGVIVNCTITNWLGPAIVVSGNNIVIRGNDLNHLHGQYAMQLQCSQSVVDHNFIHDSPNIEWFTPDELTGAAHPAGGGFYDWQCNVIASFNNGVSNILFEYNWIQGVDNQLTQIQAPDNSPDDAAGFQIVSNVFVYVMMHGSFSRNNTTIDHNTFVDCAFMIGEFNTLGQVWGTHGNSMTNAIIVNNVFVNNGEHATTANEPPYAVTTTDPTLAVGTVATNNFSVFPETLNWAATPATLGVSNNAADPVFVNKRVPLGYDGIPWTADDGLKPLANSPIVTMGGVGALPPVPFSNTIPNAHFSAVLGNPGWKDATGTNYNPGWAALTPDARGGTIRPSGTPESIGQVPTNIVFTAANGIGGLQTNWVGEYKFFWSFSDGQSCTTPRPAVNHTFLTPNVTNWVTLWVTNYYGQTSVYSNSYRTLGTNGQPLRYVDIAGNDSNNGLATNSAWRTIQHAATTASPGWFVSVGPGNFQENVDLTVSGATSNNMIRFVGHGSRTAKWNDRNNCYWIEGFELDGFGVGAGSDGLIYCYNVSSNCVFINNYLHNVTNVYGVEMPQSGGQTPEFAAHYHSISNNVYSHIQGPSNDIRGRGHVLEANIIQHTESEGDAFRLWGADHIVRGNLCDDLNSIGLGGHPDFFQTFASSAGGQFQGLTNTVFEMNTVLGTTSQICQLEWDADATTFQVNLYTNITFRNNLFANLQFAANVDMSGTKWINNLFYKVNTFNANHVFAMGGNKGAAFGTVFRNNAFVGCGNGVNNGWYPNIGDAGVFNWSMDNDYNFVTSATFGAMGGFTGLETHGVSGGDPKFVSAANNDFHLLAGSPLIAAAQTQSGFSNDNEMQTRTGTWDLGPLAFAVGAATPPDPTITGQPGSQSVTVGATATFTATASGTPTLSYQWQVSSNGGSSWSNTGSNSSTLSVVNCQLTDNGKLYRVIVTNSGPNSPATSSSALLTVSSGGGGPGPFINHIGLGHIGNGIIR